MLITGASVLTRDGDLELRQTGDTRFSFSIFPDVAGTLTWRGTPLAKTAEGVFHRYTVAVPLIGLRRFCPKIAEQGVYLYISPLRRGEIVSRNVALAVKQEFEGGQIAAIDSIEAVPEYRARIAKV